MQFAQDDVTEPNWEPLAEPSPKHRSEDSSEQHSKGAKKIKRRSGPRAGKACDHCAVKKTRVDSGPATFSNGISVLRREIVTNVMMTMLNANTRATKKRVHVASHLSMRVVFSKGV